MVITRTKMRFKRKFDCVVIIIVGYYVKKGLLILKR